MPAKPLILWFRRDLRLRDNAALAAAIGQGRPIVAVYIHDDALGGEWAIGAASRVWLHGALQALDRDLRGLGGHLVLRSGGSREVLEQLIREADAGAVYWNRRYDPTGRALDVEIKRRLVERGLEAKSFNASLLNEPHTVATKSGAPYQVYTPYFKAARQRSVEAPVEPDLEALCWCRESPQSEPLDALGLLPLKTWADNMMQEQEPSEHVALKRLESFVEHAAATYGEERDRPDLDGTSCLSPYLHFGQIGPRQIVQALNGMYETERGGAYVYLKELYWREFAHHVLYHFPHTADRPLRTEYDDFPWKEDGDLLRRWQRGQTGYPIVDAGMRQLWECGWMHNRVRMIVASLLVKQLLQSWQAGARWFGYVGRCGFGEQHAGLAMGSGCGADAALLQGVQSDYSGKSLTRTELT